MEETNAQPKRQNPVSRLSAIGGDLRGNARQPVCYPAGERQRNRWQRGPSTDTDAVCYRPTSPPTAVAQSRCGEQALSAAE